MFKFDHFRVVAPLCVVLLSCEVSGVEGPTARVTKLGKSPAIGTSLGPSPQGNIFSPSASPSTPANFATTTPSPGVGPAAELVAGNGATAFSGDGGPATLASLSSIQGIAIDSSGSIFISDGRRIRKVSAGDGRISTIAGTGKEGFSGDGGPALEADLSPLGLAVDSSGSIYVRERSAAHGGTIRRISPNGVIQTVVGGVPDQGFGSQADGKKATSVGTQALSGLVLSMDQIVVSDYGSDSLYRVDGSGVMRLVSLKRSVVDAGRRVLCSSADGSLYVVAWYSLGMNPEQGTILKVKENGEATAVVAGTGFGGASFRDVYSGTIDSSGNLLLSISGAIVKFSTDGTSSLLASVSGNLEVQGKPVYVLNSSPLQLFAYGKYLYFSDSSYNSVRRLKLP